MKKIGVFGSAFDPPTLGHKDVINQALEKFEKIIAVPSIKHAFDKKMSNLSHRKNMLKLFINHFPKKSQDKIEISYIEEEISKNKEPNSPIYTYEVLEKLTEIYSPIIKDLELYFIIGPDNASPKIWKKFYRYRDIEKSWKIFVAKQNLNVHSSQIREFISKNIGINSKELKFKLLSYLEEDIIEYIISQKLYV